MSKPKLHNSQIETLWRCGYRFYRKYRLGDFEPSSTSLAVGSAVHAATSANLTNKAMQGKPLSVEAVREIAFKETGSEFEEVELYGDELVDGHTAVRGRCQDHAVALSAHHATALAPSISPIESMPDGCVGVEWPWVLEMENWPFDLAGRMDVVEEVDAGYAIRDTKTKGISPSSSEADTSQQLTMYALVGNIFLGEMPRYVALDCLIRPGKKAKARSKVMISTRDEASFTMIKYRLMAAMDAIEKEIFLPCNPTEWQCSPKYCGFARDGSCPYFWNVTSVSMATPTVVKSETTIEASLTPQTEDEDGQGNS